MYTITKTFSFCYGHRLYRDSGKCANLHGHTAKAEISLSSEKTNQYGIAYDFRDVSKIIGDWIAENWDHKTILNKEDPLCNALKSAGETYFPLDDNPTVENIARYLFNIAKEKGLNVIRTTIWESESSSASYEK